MIDTLYTILISIATAITGGFSGWFFTRKKYNTEVDTNVIQNLLKSFVLFKETTEYNEKRIKDLFQELEKYKTKNDKLEEQLEQMQLKMFKLTDSICVNYACSLRKRSFELFGNENNSKKTVLKD